MSSGTTLGHYEVVSELGTGAMGEVYLAKDRKLGRQVAIKVLPRDVVADAARRRRFEREARAASNLSHPNIVTIYEIGEHEGTPYIAMEYVDGASLREILAPGYLSIDLLLRYATQLTEGLAKAHEAGIVHRDLKPENILISKDGYVKILDFGLAKLLPEGRMGSEVSTLSRATTPGALVGTVDYMSPEQAKGAEVDFRADQFAVGLILHEMASGKRVFRKSTPGETLAAILRDEPDPLEPHIPAPVRWIIDRCLAKNPRERFASTSDLARELHDVRGHLSEVTSEARPRSRRITLRAVLGLLGVAALLAILSTVGGLGQRLPGTGARRPIHSVAVLPLANLSGDPSQEYFADGMTEALITDLAKIESLRIISRSSVMRYKDSRKPLPEVARELGVDAVIEGSATRSGDRVRITAQLIDAATDQHLWAESYDRQMSDILSLQSDVAKSIALEIHIQLTPDEDARLARSVRVDPVAHELYLKGRAASSRLTTEGYREAVTFFEQAIEKDDHHALAYAGLAEAYVALAQWVDAVADEQVMPKAKQAALRALEIDPTLSEAHATLGSVRLFHDWSWNEAQRELERALELNPGSNRARSDYAVFLSAMGRHREALEAARRVCSTDPLDVAAIAVLASHLYYARQYDEALEQLEEALRMDPRFEPAYRVRSWVYHKKGMYEEKVAADKKNLELDGAPPEDIEALGTAYEAAGERGLWTWWLRWLTLEGEEGYVSDYSLAGVQASLGNLDEAFAALERVYQQRDGDMVWLAVDPWLDPLRDDPRFQNFLVRMKFPARTGDSMLPAPEAASRR